MQRIFSLILAAGFGLTSFSQVYQDSLAAKVNQVDSVFEQVFAYESFGPKPIGSDSLEQVRAWLTEKYTQYGYTVSYDTFSRGQIECYNVIIEKKGDDSTKWVIVGAHYDSVDDGPGANDNGTGVVATLQIAKIIKSISTKHSVRIINFSAEETGFNGSSHYVSNTLDTTDNVLLMINLDQLGGTANADNSKIVCERDEDDNPIENNQASHLSTDTLARLVALYTDLTPTLDRAFSSDYVPFENAGYVITGLYQESDYPFYHTANDVTSNIDIEATTEVIKGATAAVLHFSGMKGLSSIKPVARAQAKIYPNPTSNSFMIKTDQNEAVMIEYYNQLGQMVMRKKVITNTSISVTELMWGSYTLQISGLNDEYLTRARLIIAP